MLLLKYLLLSLGIAMFAIAAGILIYDAYLLLAWQRNDCIQIPRQARQDQHPPCAGALRLHL
jgi:hypothetical protein